jgi:hypothetical protein
MTFVIHGNKSIRVPGANLNSYALQLSPLRPVLAQRQNADRPHPVGFADGESLELVMLNHSARDNFAGGDDDAADCAFRPNFGPLCGAWINAFQMAAIEQASLLVKYHQAMPFIAVRTAVPGPSSG